MCSTREDRLGVGISGRRGSLQKPIRLKRAIIIVARPRKAGDDHLLDLLRGVAATEERTAALRPRHRLSKRPVLQRVMDEVSTYPCLVAVCAVAFPSDRAGSGSR